MADPVTFLCAVLLALTFAWSGAVKVGRATAWRDALAVYRLPGPVRAIAFVMVPMAELAVAGMVLLGSTRAAGAFATAMLCAFSAVLLRARSEVGDRVPCGCFGGRQEHDYRLLLLRNASLLIPALVLTVSGNTSIRTVPTSLEPLPAILIVGGVAVLGWTAVEVGRALRRGKPS